jgi:hypothetical protein
MEDDEIVYRANAIYDNNTDVDIFSNEKIPLHFDIHGEKMEIDLVLECAGLCMGSQNNMNSYVYTNSYLHFKHNKSNLHFPQSTGGDLTDCVMGGGATACSFGSHDKYDRNCNPFGGYGTYKGFYWNWVGCSSGNCWSPEECPF